MLWPTLPQAGSTRHQAIKTPLQLLQFVHTTRTKQKQAYAISEVMDSAIEEFLSKPLNSWVSIVLYFALCVVMGWIITFLGAKYVEVLQPRHQPLLRLNPAQSPLPTIETPTTTPVSTRFGGSRSPLSQVTTPHDIDFFSPGTSPYTYKNGSPCKSPAAYWPVVPKAVSVGRVTDSGIAQRRRLSTAKNA